MSSPAGVGFERPAAEPRFRGTMIGIAPPSVLGRAPEPNAGLPAAELSVEPLPSPVAQPSPATASRERFQRTMIGIAPEMTNGRAAAAADSASNPPAAPEPSASYPTPPPPPELPAPRVGSGTVPHISPHQKTMLGIARPGIAPLNPGQAKARPEPLSEAPSTALLQTLAEPRSSPPAPFAPLTTTQRIALPQKQGIPKLAAAAIVAAAALFAAAAVVWLFYHGHGSIEAQARALPDGKEELSLLCSACEDGTLARLDAARATFTAHRAALALSRPLRVGENPMTLTLVTPHGKQSFVDISVPIAYRVRGDTSGLDGPSPELRVLVSAIAGSNVTVDGKPVTLDAQGEGRYALDVSAEVTGLDSNVKQLDRKVPYVVTPPNAAAQNGTVTLQAGITPLVIEAPGSSVVLEGSNFVLSGRTAKAATLTVNERPITVDAAGRFAQMMNVSAPGETTIVVRATSKETAPRLFPLRVKRVDSLLKEAERVRQRATSNYAAIAEQTDTKRGWAVALDGSAVDARTENYNTVLVLDVQVGCARAPCLARVTYGAPFSISRGDKLSAYGQVTGLVDGPRSGTKIPEIHADFLIKASK